jgi:hypothetical protein
MIILFQNFPAHSARANACQTSWLFGGGGQHHPQVQFQRLPRVPTPLSAMIIISQVPQQRSFGHLYRQVTACH